MIAPHDLETLAPAWAKSLGRVFRRVAVLRIDGTAAKVIAVFGVGRHTVGRSLSLLDKTPLRWAIEAASPIVGAGAAPGGNAVAGLLGLAAPRTYVVVPMVIAGELRAIAYGDGGDDALPLVEVADLFAFCHRVLTSTGATSGRRRGPRKEQLQRRRELTASTPETPPQAAITARSAAPAVLADPPPENRVPVSAVHAEVIPPGRKPVSVPGFSEGSSSAADPDAAVFANMVAESMAALGTPPVEELPDPAELEAASADDVVDAADGSEDELPGEPVPVDHEPRIVIPPALAATMAAAAPAASPAPTPDATTTADTAPTADAAPIATAVVTPPPLPRRRPFTTITTDLVVTPAGVVPRGSTPPPPTRVGRAIASLSVAGVAMLALIVTFAPTPSGAARDLVVTIPKHASLGEIASELEGLGAVRSATGFLLLARATGVDRALRAGTYSLPRGAWGWQVLRELTRGQVHNVQVTFPEGLSLAEMARVFEHHGLAAKEEILTAARDRDLLKKYELPGATVEGFLFPETYTFARGLAAKDMLDAMLEQFFVRAAVLPDAVRADPAQLHRRVVLASIIEREARDKSELPRIAGVFQNRLERNMKLESCATVQYVLGRVKGRLTLNDVRKTSPYNTYLNLGLPPGPIASPGLAALKAAFAPERHDYLFFFARDDGSHQHVFTKTYAEHQKAQKMLASRG